jgi:hypothetical protein
MWYWALTINLPEVNSSPGKIYVITKNRWNFKWIKYKSNSIQKTLFPNWITPNLLRYNLTEKSGMLSINLLKKQYELQNYFKNYSNRFTIWILNYRCFCKLCKKLDKIHLQLIQRRIRIESTSKGFYLLEWVLVTSRLWVPVFRMV